MRSPDQRFPRGLESDPVAALSWLLQDTDAVVMGVHLDPGKMLQLPSPDGLYPGPVVRAGAATLTLTIAVRSPTPAPPEPPFDLADRDAVL